MTDTYGAAFEFAHGKLFYATDPYGTKVDVPFREPSEDSLVEVLGEFRSGMSQITLVQLDCPVVNLTAAEHDWQQISATSLKKRLGIPVRREPDMRLLVRGLAAQEESIQFPYGVLILHDSDKPKCAGYIRQYRVTDAKHWKSLPFTVGGEKVTIAAVGEPGLPLSQSAPDVRKVITAFIADHPDVERLVVWSPDDLPLKRTTYNELNSDGGASCRVTMLSDHTFVLSAALRQS